MQVSEVLLDVCVSRDLLVVAARAKQVCMKLDCLLRDGREEASFTARQWTFYTQKLTQILLEPPFGGLQS